MNTGKPISLFLLPLDDRPVTYIYPQMVAGTAGVKCFLPPRHLLGSLYRPAAADWLVDWVKTNMEQIHPSALMLCLDSILWGGLINSRRGKDQLSDVLEKTKDLKKWKSASNSIYAQSSIMRISDNYDNSEEKEYWSTYGREIYAWSQMLHLCRRGKTFDQQRMKVLEATIPPAVKTDYLQTRFRNFQVNKHLLTLAKENIIDHLVFSQDDSGEFGLNVLEKEDLSDTIRANHLGSRVFSYAGADEVLSTLVAYYLVSVLKETPTAKVLYSSEEVESCPSRYEGQSIGDTVAAQMHACGIINAASSTIAETIDFNVIVHGAGDVQGDQIWLAGHADLRRLDTAYNVRNTLKLIKESTVPVVLLDLAYANGADALLVHSLLKEKDLAEKLISYAGWNTSGNAAGSALALAVAWYFARKNQTESASSREYHKQALYVRLADDWAYQSIVRPSATTASQPDALRQLMQPHLDRISEFLSYAPKQLKLSLPWQRSFEIEINLEPESNFAGRL